MLVLFIDLLNNTFYFTGSFTLLVGVGLLLTDF